MRQKIFNRETSKISHVQIDNRKYNTFIINTLLLVSGIVMVFSGLIMQLGFHVGGSENHQNVQAIQNYEQGRGIDTSKLVCGFSYHEWSITHKYAIVLFSLIMLYHLYLHWNWYKIIVKKHLITKNVQVILLTILFFGVAITGLVPWFIDLSGSISLMRFGFIEIHDKIAIILFVFLILHVNKRKKWFVNVFRKK